MAEVLDKELAQRFFCNDHGLFKHAWSAEFSGYMIKGHNAPSGRRKRFYFGKQAFIATAQGDEGHAEGVEAGEAGVSGEF